MEQKEDLVDWVDSQFIELSKNLGLELQMIDHPTENKQGSTPISGTITFLKGDSAKKAKEFYQKRKEEE